MKSKYLTIIILLFSFIFLFSNCNNKKKTENKTVNINKLKEPLILANKNFVKMELQHIKEYVKRHKWEMKKTGSGLSYMIYHYGNGKKIITNDTVIINFEVKLLSGEVCYSTKDNDFKKIIVDKSLIEKGLNEGILLLNYGDKAKFILPSHLAFGLSGDNKKIPPKAILIYDVETIESINKKNNN